MPMLMKGMSWRMNHAQLKYTLKVPGTLNDEVSYGESQRQQTVNPRLRANVQFS